MVTTPTPNAHKGQPGHSSATPAAQPITPVLPAAANTMTGVFAGQKAPAVNGIAVLQGGGVQSFTAPALQGGASSPLPAAVTHPLHLVGDLSNGVAVADSTQIYYMTGVGVTGAIWNALSLPKGVSNIVSLSGDLVNGLVVTDGYKVFAWPFSGASANTWLPMAELPSGMTVGDMAGDPTNGVLLALNGVAGPSSLYFGGSGCACSWVALVATGSSLPSARVAVTAVSGNYANGFVLFGENQLFTLSGMKYTPAAGSAAASATGTWAKINNAAPFQITDLCGDPTTGITARSGTALIANAQTPFASWTLVNAAAPAAPAANGAAVAPAPQPAQQPTTQGAAPGAGQGAPQGAGQETTEALAIAA